MHRAHRTRRTHRRTVLLLFALVISVVLAGCIHGQLDGPGQNSDEPGDNDTAAERGERESVMVAVDDNTFEPDTVTAAPGQQITFQNVGETRHTVTLPEIGLDQELAPGDIANVVIPREGRYSLNCRFHEGMDGEIVIAA